MAAGSFDLFCQWLSTREAVLEALYPNRAAAVPEVLAYAAQTRVMELESLLP